MTQTGETLYGGNLPHELTTKAAMRFNAYELDLETEKTNLRSEFERLYRENPENLRDKNVIRDVLSEPLRRVNEFRRPRLTENEIQNAIDDFIISLYRENWMGLASEDAPQYTKRRANFWPRVKNNLRNLAPAAGAAAMRTGAGFSVARYAVIAAAVLLVILMLVYLFAPKSVVAIVGAIVLIAVIAVLWFVAKALAIGLAAVSAVVLLIALVSGGSTRFGEYFAWRTPAGQVERTVTAPNNALPAPATTTVALSSDVVTKRDLKKEIEELSKELQITMLGGNAALEQQILALRKQLEERSSSRSGGPRVAPQVRHQAPKPANYTTIKVVQRSKPGVKPYVINVQVKPK